MLLLEQIINSRLHLIYIMVESALNELKVIIHLFISPLFEEWPRDLTLL